jgi:PKD repeat protein
MKALISCVTLCITLLLAGKCEGQLSAHFSTDISNGCSPFVVNFLDQSTGEPQQWRWDLGNGTISTLQNPSAIYVYSGFYTVKLWVKAGNQTDSITMTDYVEVFNSPEVNFTSDHTSGCSPFPITFNDQSIIRSGNVVAWQWDFGDGILSNQQNPNHVYLLPGHFNVTLKAFSNNGCVGTSSKPSYVTSNMVKAAFTTSIPVRCVPNRISFTSQSTSSTNLIYNWDFGDGTIGRVDAESVGFTGARNFEISIHYELKILATCKKQSLSGM